MPVKLRGKLVCACVAEVFPLVEADMLARGLIRYSIDLFQGGYNRGGVAASAGTHDLGGCFDVGQYSDDQIAVWRRWGVTMQRRTVAQGFDPHGHGFPRGCPHLSEGAKFQASEWEARRNGLRGRGRVEGPWPILSFGAAIARNATPVTPSDLQRIADATSREILRLVGPRVWDAALPASPSTTVAAKVALSNLGTLARPNPKP